MIDFITLKEFIALMNKAPDVLRIMDTKTKSHGLILRHDVDESIDFAYTLFQAENNIGIKSTFHILLTSDLYNPFSKKNRAYLEEMHINGFEIGLHFDPMSYAKIEDTFLIEKFEEETFIFEKTLNMKLYSYSMHQPSVSGKYIEYDKLINAYGKDIFSPDKYISDSAYSFRGKDINEYIMRSESELIQMLIHADHMMSDGKVSYEKAVNLLLENYLHSIHNLYGDNPIYQQQKDNYTIKVRDE